MHRLRTACTVVSVLALSGVMGCTREAEAPPEPVAAAPAPASMAVSPVSYACESGQSVTVGYPDANTARLTYKGQTYALRAVPSGSGARYSGSGVEWWSAARDGTETATLSRLGPDQDVGVAVLERCSRPSSGLIAPRPTPVLQPAPGGVLAGAAPCRGPQLKLSNDGGDAGMGHRIAIMALQNVGAEACSLTGYPAVTLRDARDRPLDTVRAVQRPGSYLRQGQAPTPVTLAPRGKAYFDLAWTVIPHEGEGETTCPNAARIHLTVPGDTSAVSVAQSFSPCGGEVEVSPVRAEASPDPAPAT